MGGTGATTASDRLAERHLGRRFAPLLAALRRGLEGTGYAEGRNLQIEYRWADDDAARLPALAADLVRANVELIVTSGGPQPASAAMRATAAIPIVASSAAGLVQHYNRPEGNLTGVSFLTGVLTPKRLELLVELVPGVAIAVLARPAYSQYEPDRKEVEKAAQLLGVEVRFVTAGTDADLEPAFTSLAKLRAGGLLISADPFFNSRREQLVALAERYAIPAMHEWRESVAAGGLISYAQASPACIAYSAPTPERSSRVPSRPICRSSNQPHSSWSSISKPQKRSASPCRHRSSPAPTR
jgi:putative ABC transport system substrate-binding protein